jgi:hypothetical protein
MASITCPKLRFQSENSFLYPCFGCPHNRNALIEIASILSIIVHFIIN